MLKLKVTGMTCGGCASSVTRAIKAVAPAVEVKVDLKSGEVAITGAAQKSAVVAAIEDAGYDVAGEAA
jgi:copper chaperone